MERIELSQVVVDCDTTGMTFEFTVLDIDSIGNYLPFHTPGYLQFRDFGDSIRVTTGHTKPNQWDSGSCCHLYILIGSDDTIEAYNAKGERLKKRKRFNVEVIEFAQSMAHQRKGKKNIDVILKKD